MTRNANIVKKIEVDGDYIRITILRNLATSDAEQCRYQIKVEGEGLVVDAVEDYDGVDELITLEAFDHEWEPHTCPECKDSEVPGKHYNNNDPTSGQFHNCTTCNKDGDLGPDYPDYDPPGG